MQRSEFIYQAVVILFSVRVQSTIAIENYTNETNEQFNLDVLDYFNKWCSEYDETMKQLSIGCDVALCDALLIHYLRTFREKEIKLTLDYIDNKIIKKAGIDYDITAHYNQYEDDHNIKNPFEHIIYDIRTLEEKKTQDTLHSKENQEDNQMAIRKDIVWFSEDELELLRKAQENKKTDNGELGGHISYPKVSHDTSYLLNKQQGRELYERCVLGAIKNAE